MIRRPRRVIPASIVALLVLAAMVILVWSCIQVLLGQQPILPFTSLAEQGTRLHWNDLPVLISGGLLAALGLTLLTCAWLPGAPKVLALADLGSQTQAGATRRSVRQAVTTAAGRVDGVSSAAAHITPTRVRATVHTPLRETDALPEKVRAAIGDQLTTIGLQRSPRISVRVNRTRSN
jgi:hypothetical protein